MIRWRLGTWTFRAGYVLSLLTIGSICLSYYFSQQHQNRELHQDSLLSEQFHILETSLADFAAKAGRVSEAPDDSALPSLKNTLQFHQNRASQDFDKLERLWWVASKELRTEIVNTSRYMLGPDPFKHHRQILNATKLSDANTIDDVRWFARVVAANFASFVTETNHHAIHTIEIFLHQLHMGQGQLIENFVLISLGSIAALGLFIFIPIDLMIRSILRNMNQAKTEAVEAEKRTKIADRAKSEFLANMSHEIRTPMNGVMGMAELLAKTELDAKQKMFTDVIVKSGSALLAIINDVLDFSKIDAGQLQLSPTEFNLADAVSDVANLFASKFADKDLELLLRLQPDLPPMFIGDVGRLRQIITNLLGNAVKFTETGHVSIEVSGTTAERHTKLQIRVVDTGVGIAEDSLDAIFDKFSQVDSSATRKHEGSGLGLAISSALVALMGGQIGVDSKIGKGSTFWFDIELPVHGEVKPANPIPSHLIGSRILTIAANPVCRDLLENQLKAWQFDVAVAPDGSSGLSMLRNAAQADIPVSLVVLDYHLIGMDGAEALGFIRQDPRIGNTPIIMMTSVDETEEGKTFASLNLQGYITKPVRVSQLAQIITEVLQQAHGQKFRSNGGIEFSRHSAQMANA